MQLTAGLSTEEAARRRAVFGPNALKGRKQVHPVVLFLKHLVNVMTVILFIALGLSLAVHEWIEASVIAFVIILNAVVGFVQEYGSEKTMQVRFSIFWLRLIAVVTSCCYSYGAMAVWRIDRRPH